MENNKLATVNETAFAVATIADEDLAAIAEELSELGSISFDTIKIPAGGGLAFEVPGDVPDAPEMVQEITGVIVHHHACNSFWESSYEGGNVPPDCYSADGKVGLDARTGQICDCADCPRNEFGSDGEGKACKNMQRVYILRPGDLFPVVINVPPTSLKPWKDYVAKRILLKGKRPGQVLTKFRLCREKNAGGITYSKLTLAFGGDLSAADAAAVAKAAVYVKAILAEQAKRRPEPEEAPEAVSAEFKEIEDEALPFA